MWRWSLQNYFINTMMFKFVKISSILQIQMYFFKAFILLLYQIVIEYCFSNTPSFLVSFVLWRWSLQNYMQKHIVLLKFAWILDHRDLKNLFIKCFYIAVISNSERILFLIYIQLCCFCFYCALKSPEQLQIHGVVEVFI